jgi:hypothetical protein
MATACGDAGEGAREAAGQAIRQDQAQDPAKARVEAEGSTATLDGRASRWRSDRRQYNTWQSDVDF